ncbi:MAG TPA: hypothetical protein VI386_31555 [Candidatus Sulfotelmatobacter sp.]
MRVLSLFSSLSGMGLLFVAAGSSFAQDTNFPVGPQYLITNDSPLFARPIATPSLSLETQTAAAADNEVTEPQTALATDNSQAESSTQPDLFAIYYGERAPVESVVVLQSPVAEAPLLPASFFNDGVTEMVDVQDLRYFGYGISLVEDAALWKRHKSTPARTYTNQDIERLKQGG